MTLDISIKSADKHFTSQKKFEEFFTSKITVHHKVDGIKLNVIKIANNGLLSDYIFSYKGNILYPGEFDYVTTAKIKKESIGASQFKLVFEHFKKNLKNNIPIGTGMFIEFLMKKPTLSSNYTINHKMILIGYSYDINYSISFGKLKIEPPETTELITDDSDNYNFSKIICAFDLDRPSKLFEGHLNPEQFGHGIINEELKELYNERIYKIWKNDAIDTISYLKDLFLTVKSKYGGIEEGVILKYNDTILKWQQDYQCNKESRLKIKMQFKENDAELETLYWKNVIEVSLSLIVDMNYTSELPKLLLELSSKMKELTPSFSHSKKNTTNIKDDIQLTAKLQIIKRLNGNNNALILGKFRVLTKGHIQLLNKAKQFDNITICLVSSKETSSTKTLRESMIKSVYPNINIIHARTGNLISIMQKSPLNINTVITGSDRVISYNEQLKNSVGVDVLEVRRNDKDISASKVIYNINDENYFKNNTPKGVHQFYKDILKEYGNERELFTESGENVNI